MSRLSFFGHNFKLLFEREWAKLLLEQEQKLDTRINDFEQRNATRISEYEQAFDERIIRQEQAFDQRVEAFEHRNDTRMDGYERAVDLRLDEREEATRQWLEERQEATRQWLEEREKATRQWLEERHAALDLRLDEREQLVDKRLDTFEATLTERLTKFEKALSESLNQFTTATSNRLDGFESAITERLNERDIVLDERLDERATQAEIHLDKRFDERFIALEKRADERTARFELQIDQRFDERIGALENHANERHHTLEQRSESRLTELMRTFELRFDERTHLLEVRADGRLNALDKHLDERFVRLEKTADSRMEAHERLVDGKLKINREDLVDRTDVMLQLFEQRLDEQRRAIRHLREQLAQRPAQTQETLSAEPLPELKEVLQETPVEQVQSFRKLAEGYHPLPANKLPKAETALYHRILDWKKVAHEGLNDFTPDEKEVVDYVISFISDPAEQNYVMQHMRRFLSTLERIPPPQRSTDRLLELGSLLHFAPALSKYTGYQVFGADFWESDERVSLETLKQVNGIGQHQIELRNFNVEADPFPYPDQHFRVVLCCELIEHLQRDPLHMLWECNRVLQDDGFLLLTTPNIASARSIEGLLITCSPYLLSQYNRETPVDQHNHEYAPYEVGVALAAAGFTVVALEAEDVWLRSNPAIIELLAQLEISTDLRGDNLFALARKTSAPIERYPKELYVQ